MKRVMLLLFSLTLVSAASDVIPASLEAVKSEPVWHKRSRLALEFAMQALGNAKNAYKAGDMRTMQADLNQIGESAKLCLSALQESGKKARNDKHHKHAEMKLRELARHLADFRNEVEFDEQSVVGATLKQVQDIHDRLLLEVMGKGN